MIKKGYKEKINKKKRSINCIVSRRNNLDTVYIYMCIYIMLYWLCKKTKYVLRTYQYVNNNT